MFCSQCGKKVNDTMLFCPFCGAALVLPEQDDDARPAPPVRPIADNVNAAPVRTAADSVNATPFRTAADSVNAAPVRAAADNVNPAPVRTAADSVNAAPVRAAADNVNAAPVRAAADSMNPVPAEPAVSARPEIEDVPEEAFEPLDLDAFAQSKPHVESLYRRADSEDDAPILRTPVHLEGNVPDLSSVRAPVRPKTKASKRRPSTYVPQKAFNPDDIFLDGDGDDFDDPEPEEDFSFEEPLEGGFFERHIRGMVGLMAFAILLIVLLGWALSSSGQRTLANVNLAWRADAYEQIAYDAYQNQNYTLSAEYYLKALARNPESYDYAYSAGVMYLWNSDSANAAEMAKRAIQIDPSRADAYKLLLQAYPDVSTRPWEIQSLIEQGYQKTGLEELKPSA